MGLPPKNMVLPLKNLVDGDFSLFTPHRQPKCNQNQKTFLLVTENNDTGYLKETILGRANFQIIATVK